MRQYREQCLVAGHAVGRRIDDGEIDSLQCCYFDRCIVLQGGANSYCIIHHRLLKEGNSYSFAGKEQTQATILPGRKNLTRTAEELSYID